MRQLLNTVGIACLLASLTGNEVRAEDAGTISLPKMDGVSYHVQSTFLPQGLLPFHSVPGAASGDGNSTETWTVTGFFGARLWQGGEVYINPELFHGFFARDFPTQVAVAAGVGNGEAQKGGRWDADVEVARAYFTQTIGFGGEKEMIKDDLNVVASTKDVSRLTLTAGRFAISDFFDNNTYAHDPRTQFMNWSLWEAGAFDYAADVKGYTYGAMAELNQKSWSFRAGYFLVPAKPNALELDTNIGERGSAVAELENRYEIFNQAGKLRLTAWENTAFTGNYAEAVAQSSGNPDIEATQKVRTNYGFIVNVEQAITKDIGAFFRYSWNPGRTQLCCFTDINESVAGGFSIKGASWGRPDDTVGIGAAHNSISPSFRNYLAAGGGGLLIGDGALPRYAGENTLETYYSYAVSGNVTIAGDYQFIDSPAYNAARDPVHLLSGRLHLQF